MLPGRLINRLKLSHKSLCHWLLCFDCILLVRWWCQVRTIIMLVMYFVIASAWCIMEATMHTEYFSGQRLSMDPFFTLKFILFTAYRVLHFSVKNWINFVCLLFRLNTRRNCCVTTFQILSLSWLSCVTVCFCFYFYFLQEERLLRMGDELSRLASYEAECHRKDGVIAALRDEVVDLKGALQSSGSFRYICPC